MPVRAQRNRYRACERSKNFCERRRFGCSTAGVIDDSTALVTKTEPMQDKISISIAMQHAHSGPMHGDAIDKAMTYSFWALGFLLSAGIVLAVLVW